MFYLTKIVLGTETGIHSSPTDIYVNNMNINCSNSVNVPAGAAFVKSINIKCTGVPVPIAAKVYRQ